MLVNKERADKEILTIHGFVHYRRTILAPADSESKQKLISLTGQKSVVPIDDLLGVSRLPFKITCKMMSHIAKEATMARSYAEAAERINKEIDKPISISTIENVTDYVGELMYRTQIKTAKDAERRLKDRVIDKRRIHRRKEDVLYIETDGAMIHVRDKENVELEEYAPLPDNGSIKHNPGWTESKHALCFHADSIKYYWKDNANEHHSGRFADILALGDSITVTGHRIETRDCIGYIGKADKFQYHLLSLAERNDWEHCAKVVVLSDGAKWIKGVKDNIFHGRPVIQILDLFHAKENAGKFANWAKRGKLQKKSYADHLCSLIEQGKVEKLLEELEPYKDVKTPMGIPNLYTYILNNRDCMDYPRYKREGLFVGSGAMESANIYMMQDRMKLQGMRWLVANGRHMLCLKTHYASRTWSQVDMRIAESCCISG